MDSREQPRRGEFLVWPFLLIALIVGVLAVVNLSHDGSAASFVDTNRPQAVEVPTPILLPTPQPTPELAAEPAVLTATLDDTGVVLAGVAPAQPVLDAVIRAFETVRETDPVDTAAVIVDTTAESVGARLLLVGQVADSADRVAVLDAVANLGLQIEADRLVLVGSDRNVADVVASETELSQFAGFVAAAGFDEVLGAASEEGITLFAPTNAAIEALDSVAFNDLADPAVLRYYVLSGTHLAADLAAKPTYETLQGEVLSVSSADGALVVGGAVVTVTDIAATNGIVHVIDGVLLPLSQRVEVSLNGLVTADPVQFASGSASILEASFPTLDAVAQTLVDNKTGRVVVQGHTDSAGEAALNRELSLERARAVVAYLVGRGVDRPRLAARGFGESRPLVTPEDTDDDRQANRRIEFRVRS